MFAAKTIMSTDVITIRSNRPILDAIRLLVKHDLGSIPVVDDKENLTGIISEKDALSLLQNNSEKKLYVRDLMTKEVVHFDESGSLIEISKALIKNHFRTIPITKNGKKVVGVISRTHIMRTILEMKSVSVEHHDLDGEDA